MNNIRHLIDTLISSLDRFTQSTWRPRHSPEQQAHLDAQTRTLALYHYTTCPFCIKTRHAIRRLGLNIELRDVKNDPRYRHELLNQGGKLQVPCLRIEENGQTRWLYESNDIIAYLQTRFA